VSRTERATLAAAILGSAIVFLDGTIVNIALKNIGEELPATIVGKLEGEAYVSTGYLATLAALLILAGALGDYYGRRRIFLYGLVGFGITSAACGLAPTLELLAVARVFQGIAGALLVPGALSIITSTFDGPARGRAFGIWAAATSGVTTFGPPIGGILVQLVSWRSAFLINIPLVIVAVWLTVRYMRETRDETASGHFDWLGAFVAAVAVGGLSFGIIRAQQQQWHDPVAFAAIGVGLVGLVAFPILMKVRAHPLVPLSLFRIRAFAAINLSTLLIYGALYANFTFQSLFLQGTLGYSPLGAALIGLPTGIILTFLSTRVGTVAGRIGARRFLVGGPLIMAAGLLWWLRVPASSQPWTAILTDSSTLVPPFDAFTDPLPSVLLFGVGIALVVAPLTSTLMSSIPVRNAGLGSAINNALSRIGSPIVVPLLFVVLNGAFYSALAAAVPGTDPNSASLRHDYVPLNPSPAGADPALANAAKLASTDAFHLAVILCAALLILGAVVNLVGLRAGVEEAREDKPVDAGRKAVAEPASESGATPG
jgi:EmrB/QacA subfamily drug resistance transporter